MMTEELVGRTEKGHKMCRFLWYACSTSLHVGWGVDLGSGASVLELVLQSGLCLRMRSKHDVVPTRLRISFGITQGVCIPLSLNSQN